MAKVIYGEPASSVLCPIRASSIILHLKSLQPLAISTAMCVISNEKRYVVLFRFWMRKEVVAAFVYLTY
ncbi:hypothetical protein [Proteiniphilum sp. X52]|uniref:hypothetical protein n=1 Tax=Proteiniphilum sp. X52 TaxID=2382159 RepID=UPI0013149C5E|nr:hypothetical protein [Proteiniphilum sp. X52]